MLIQDKPPGPREQIAVAVTIAALSALCVNLITWGVEEMKHKFGTKPEKK
jgi:hypothetical protein